MARIHIVAVVVVRVFAVKAVEATEVAPADVARHHLHLVRLFHHRVVNGVAGNRHHVFAVDADRFALFNSRIGKRLLGGGEHFRRILTELSEESLCLEAEDAAVPVEVAGEQVLFGSGEVGLFHEALHVFACGLDVAVAGLGARRRDAEGHEVARLGEFLRAEKYLLVLVLLADHVVRRGNEHDGLRIHGEAGESDRGGGVAAHGFQEKLASGHAFHLELVLREEELVGIGDDKLGFARRTSTRRFSSVRRNSPRRATS